MSHEQSKDAGLALVLICLLVSYFGHGRLALLIGIILLVVTMTTPSLFKPFAKLWFGLSHVLGGVVSKILLSLLFFAMIVPVGLARKAFGKDAMRLKDWKKDSSSVFRDRDHLFIRADLEKPY